MNGNFHGEISFDRPLPQFSTFRTGGTAELFIAPEDSDSFVFAFELLRRENVPFFLLGGGSTIVFPDGEFTGAVVSTRNCGGIRILGEDGDFVLVECQSGASFASFVNFCADACISGMEKFAGLPGSVGGAVYMNARCFDLSVSDIFCSAEFLDLENLSRGKIEFSASDWDYKRSPFQKFPFAVLSAVFRLKKESPDRMEKIRGDCAFYVNERVSKGHFRFPSAGSVFKNNRKFGAPSGKIIEDAGLKGFSVGGAEVAPWHGNFIINTGNASGTDIRNLTEHIRKTVFERTGFVLEPEIVFVDNKFDYKDSVCSRLLTNG